MVKKIILTFFFLTCLGGNQTGDTISQKDIQFQQDLTCLARNIYHEASGESLEGKRAVTQVVLNRTKDSRFPSNICGVVYQKTGKTYQFSWTLNPDKKITDSKTWNECVEVAKRALSKDVAHKALEKSNALFYHATYVKPKWKKRIVVAKIGKHIFYAS